MLKINYKTWKSICDMYFLSKPALKSYLQWFPFSKLSKKDKTEISSENFYNKYIKISNTNIKSNYKTTKI